MRKNLPVPGVQEVHCGATNALPGIIVQQQYSKLTKHLLYRSHPYDGLRTFDLEVRCPQPSPKAENLTIQVFSHCD
jgi:hypothetical protein